MKLIKNKDANIKMLGGVLALFITLAIGILVAYNVVSSINSRTLDVDAPWGYDTDQSATPNVARNNTPAQNATNATLSQMSTFFTIAPIIGIVIVAVVILGYVSRIGGGGG